MKTLTMCLVLLALLFTGCFGNKKEQEKEQEPKSLTDRIESELNTLSDTAEELSRIESGLNKLSDVAEELSTMENSERATLAASLDIMGYEELKPQVLGEFKPKIRKSDYPLKKDSTSYGLFGIKVLALKAKESTKASFNYTIVSAEPDKCTLNVEHSDFKSDSASGPISVYYFGDMKDFGANGPAVGQKFLAYVSYHASSIKVGIALPIIVIDGIELK